MDYPRDVMGLSAVGLFAGIGGIERGLEQAGHHAELLCESDPGAQAVLRRQFEAVPLHPDVRHLPSLPQVDLVAAGFPCQDLSQAGRTAGIGGERSSLVEHVFRLVGRRRGGPRWLLLENVPFMLQLERGEAMRYLTATLEDLGYRWAYRVVDARAFGLPQRRMRVLLLASRTADPREVLFADDVSPRPEGDPAIHACGFYWTEGVRGLGWAVDAVPTLKGGSTIGIASPPAVRLPADRSLVTPGIMDGERLQGFPAGWTVPAVEEAGSRSGHRWKLVGNAVSVPVFRWLGLRLAGPGEYDGRADGVLQPGDRWPTAAWGRDGVVHRSAVTTWPTRLPYQHLSGFLQETSLLSARATSGFLRRAESSNLHFIGGFMSDVRAHLERMTIAA